MARVGFIGTGEIAAAMVRGLAGLGHEILVSDRNAATATRLADEIAGVSVLPNAGVVDGADVVFLCLLAPVAVNVLPGLPFRAGQTVISVMVDLPLARLRNLCAPATDIAIAIPLPPVAGGGCPIPVYPASAVLEALFGGRNIILPQRDEAALNAHLGACALCSPLLEQMLTATNWLAGFTGDPVGAEAYVSAMIRAYLPESPGSGLLAEALRKLSTEGGFNATLRAAMSSANTDLRNGLDSFRGRLGLDGVLA